MNWDSVKLMRPEGVQLIVLLIDSWDGRGGRFIVPVCCGVALKNIMELLNCEIIF